MKDMIVKITNVEMVEQLQMVNRLTPHRKPETLHPVTFQTDDLNGEAQYGS